MLKKILVAFDFSLPADRALAYAADLAQATAATLEVVHVQPDLYDGHGDVALGIPWPTRDQEDRYMRFLDQELLRAAHAVLGDRAEKVKRHVVRGDPVKRLQEVARESGADLVCLGSTGKGGVARVLLGSVSLLMLRTSEIPVLVVH